MDYIPEIFYVIPGLGYTDEKNLKLTHDRAFYSEERTAEERTRLKRRTPSPVKYGLTRKANPKTGGLVSPTSFWAVFDKDNGHYHDHETGWAWVFLFTSRQAARDYVKELEVKRNAGQNIISVTNPVQYFIQ